MSTVVNTHQVRVGFIGVVNNGLVLTGVQIYWQMVVRGFILIVAVTLDSFRKGGGYR